MPLFGQLGCNKAACHGGSTGQGNFRLSLFGGDPTADYEMLTRHAAGRRISRSEPEESLLLAKTTGRLPHEGGAALRSDDEARAIILAWLRRGAPFTKDEPTLTSVKLTAPARPLSPGDRAPLRLRALYSDGESRDVTRKARFEVLDPSVARVDAGGRFVATSFGEAIVVASYERASDVARILVPRVASAPFPPRPANAIDVLVDDKLRALGLRPSELADDATFLRRVSLDLTGALPSLAQTRAFLADRDPRKRARLVDSLMASEGFIERFALKWGDLLRIKSEFPVRVWPKGTQAYHRFVRQSLRENKPYDRFARELLLSTGSNFRDGAVNFFRANSSKDPQTLGETAAVLFLGNRLACARCHAHPNERWNMDDNLGLGAFFSKVAFKPTQEWKEEIVYVNPKATLTHPRTREPVAPKPLGAAPLHLPAERDPRGAFVDWLLSPKNPHFARAITNRVWSWFMGRGLAHEPDDLRPSNPPTHPELQDRLAAELVRARYDLRALFRLILGSHAYQRSSRPNAVNGADARHYARYVPRRLPAEALLDAIGKVTETSEPFTSPIPEPFTVAPPGYRAAELHDGDLSSPFLQLFGRAPRDTPYESDRNLATSLRQELHLINSAHIQNRIAKSPRILRWLKSKTPDSAIVEELYLSALCRPPTAEERKTLLAHLAAPAKERQRAIEDVVWAVLNTAEFLLQH